MANWSVSCRIAAPFENGMGALALEIRQERARPTLLAIDYTWRIIAAWIKPVGRIPATIVGKVHTLPPSFFKYIG